MYTTEELEKRRKLAQEAKCHAGALYWSSTAEELQKICNGVGPEYFPEILRDIISWIYRNVAAAADIHDCRYEESDGSEDNRSDADLEFLDNSFRLLQYKYGSWKWIRPGWYADKKKANIAYEALVAFGCKAWQEAFQRRIEREGLNI